MRPGVIGGEADRHVGIGVQVGVRARKRAEIEALLGLLRFAGGDRPWGASIRFPREAPIPSDALLIRAGLTDEGDRLAAFDVETDPATTLEQILTRVDAAGWTVEASGGASRTVVLELSHEGVEYTITITAPEEEGELVTVAFYYPAGDA